MRGRVDLLITVEPDVALLKRAVFAIALRTPFTLSQSLSAGAGWHETASVPTGWSGDVFHRQYLPRTRLVLLGRGQDLDVTARSALATGYDVHIASPDPGSLSGLARLGIPTTCQANSGTWV